MRKHIKRIVSIIMVAAVLSVPALAERVISNFYFSTVAYDWGGGDTAFRVKDNESDAVINTLSSAGGSVTPSQLFNTRLQKKFLPGAPMIVGHKWACAPNARELIPYDFDNMSGAEVRAQFSTRSAGATAVMDGSWSPDSEG